MVPGSLIALLHDCIIIRRGGKRTFGEFFFLKIKVDAAMFGIEAKRVFSWFERCSIRLAAFTKLPK